MCDSSQSLRLTAVPSLKPGYLYRLCQQVRMKAFWDTDMKTMVSVCSFAYDWQERLGIDASVSYNIDNIGKKRFSWAQF